MFLSNFIILLIKATAAQNEDALRYHSVRGLYFLAVVFAATIYELLACELCKSVEIFNILLNA